MAYTPINNQVFTAAYSGALAGMRTSERMNKSTDPSSYVDSATVAGAWAQSFDQSWNNAVASSALDVENAFECSYGVWAERGNPDANAVTTDPDTYSQLTGAIVAVMIAGRAYYAAQGITPPPFAGGGNNGETVRVFRFSFSTPSPVNLGAIAAGSTFNRAAVLFDQAFNDGTATVALGPAGAPTELLAPSDSSPSNVGQYENDAIVSVPTPDFLTLTISPGTSTQGGGLVLWKVAS